MISVDDHKKDISLLCVMRDWLVGKGRGKKMSSVQSKISYLSTRTILTLPVYFHHLPKVSQSVIANCPVRSVFHRWLAADSYFDAHIIGNCQQPVGRLGKVTKRRRDRSILDLSKRKSEKLKPGQPRKSTQEGRASQWDGPLMATKLPTRPVRLLERTENRCHSSRY